MKKSIESLGLTLKKVKMTGIKGGTSTTLMTEVGRGQGAQGRGETEYKDTNGNGILDDDERKQKPILVDW